MPGKTPVRVVLLGASNAVLGLKPFLAEALSLAGGPVDVLAAIGLGRAYGLPSLVLGRGRGPILSSGLWRALSTGPAPAAALVTDVGNDLLYGASLPDVTRDVDEAVGRLRDAGARVVVGGLPLQRLLRVSPASFRAFRALFFPSHPLERERVRADVCALDERLRLTALGRGVTFLPADRGWYRLDPVHVARAARARRWRALLAAAGVEGPAVPAPRLPSDLRLRTLASESSTLFGVARRAPQPALRLPDGSTLSLY